MKFRRSTLERSRSYLVQLAEAYALEHNVSMGSAGKIIVADEAHRHLVLSACGNWYKGKPPSPRVFRKWYNADKLKVAAEWPNITDETLTLIPEGMDPQHFAAPYLEKKYRPQFDPVQMQMDSARDFSAKGYSAPQVAEMIGVSTSTIYRWKAQSWLRSTPQS